MGKFKTTKIQKYLTIESYILCNRFIGHKWKTKKETHKVKVDYCHRCCSLKIEEVVNED